MNQPILLRGASQLLTLRGTPGVRRGPDFGNLGVIEDGSVFIRDGKIASVGSTRRLENLKEVRGALEIPVYNCIVMPGFVDPFIRLSLAPPHASESFKHRKLKQFYDDSITLMRSCLLHGTLNAGVKASSGMRSISADISVLRQLARIGNSPVGLTRTWCPDDDFTESNVAALSNGLQNILKRKLAASFQVKIASNPALSQHLLATANRGGMSLSLDWSGEGTMNLKAALDRSASGSVFCHHDLSPEDCGVLAKSTAIAIFKAGDALLDDQPIGSVRNLADAGGAIALGSGYDAWYEPNFNMQLVLSLAVRRLRLSIEQALVATTINAACAINCGDQVGSLEPGKRADLLVLSLNDYREIPRRSGVNHVAMVIRDGNLAINRTRWNAGAA